MRNFVRSTFVLSLVVAVGIVAVPTTTKFLRGETIDQWEFLSFEGKPNDEWTPVDGSTLLDDSDVLSPMEQIDTPDPPDPGAITLGFCCTTHPYGTSYFTSDSYPLSCHAVDQRRCPRFPRGIWYDQDGESCDRECVQDTTAPLILEAEQTGRHGDFRCLRPDSEYIWNHISVDITATRETGFGPQPAVGIMVRGEFIGSFPEGIALRPSSWNDCETNLEGKCNLRFSLIVHDDVVIDQTIGFIVRHGDAVGVTDVRLATIGTPSCRPPPPSFELSTSVPAEGHLLYAGTENTESVYGRYIRTDRPITVSIPEFDVPGVTHTVTNPCTITSPGSCTSVLRFSARRDALAGDYWPIAIQATDGESTYRTEFKLMVRRAP